MTRRGPGGRPKGRPGGADNAAGSASGDVHDPEGERLQKVLARAGVASRRQAESLITEGRVSVDGRTVTELGTRVGLGAAVHVDGMRVQVDPTLTYLALNKPRGVVSTMSDDQGRPTLLDMLPLGAQGLFHVGRLDVDTEGLILVTNDGTLAHRLTHPSYGVPKTYLAEVPGPIPRDLGRRLRAGIELDDGPASVDSFAVVDSAPGKALLEVVIHEGRNRIVRRMLSEVGHPAHRLVRVRFGPIALGDLKPGGTRNLNRDEVARLHAVVDL